MSSQKITPFLPIISVVGSKCSNCGCGKAASTRGALTSHARSVASHHNLSLPKVQKVGHGSAQSEITISKPQTLPYKVDAHTTQSIGVGQNSPQPESKISYLFGNRSTKKCDKAPSHHSGHTNTSHVTGTSLNIFEQMSNPENLKNLNPNVTPNPFLAAQNKPVPNTIYGQSYNNGIVDFKNQNGGHQAAVGHNQYQPQYTKNPGGNTPCNYRKCGHGSHGHHGSQHGSHGNHHGHGSPMQGHHHHNHHGHGMKSGESHQNLTLGKRSVASVETRNSYIIRKFLMSNKERSGHKDSTGCLIGPNGTLKSKISIKEATAQQKLEALASDSNRSNSSEF